MNKNANMNKAKRAKNDEFYTTLDDISIEMANYFLQFKGKKILCNCNDGPKSNFFLYFSLQYDFLQLKELTCISYERGGRGKMWKYHGDQNGNRRPDPEEFDVTELQGDGSFDSDEAVRALDEADVVVTNPPFSRFRDFIDLLVAHGKKFLVIGNKNAYSCKDIFPLFMQNRLWVGYSSPKEFRQPDSTTKKFGNIGWFTNLDVKKRHEEQVLFRKYTPERYPKYDNYDAINVNEVCEIPEDYHGVMGVPITFLDHYDPDQFEIVGLSSELAGPISGNAKPGRFYVNGRRLYERVAIRTKRQ